MKSRNGEVNNDYSFKNKKTLREIVKLTWTDSI